MTETLRDAAILICSFFVLTAAIGVARFPDLYTRLHASAKLVTLGMVGAAIGVALEFASEDVTTRSIAIVLFQFLTAPLSAYSIARASYLRGLQPMLELGDEWGALGSAQGEPPSDEIGPPARDERAEQTR